MNQKDQHSDNTNPAPLEPLMMMYNEHAHQARQHETLRQQMTNISMVITAAILTVIFTKGQSAQDNYLIGGLVLFLLGIYGLLFSQKHHERNRLHVSILKVYRNQIDRHIINKDVKLGKLRGKGRRKHETNYGSGYKWGIRQLRAHQLWNIFHLGVLTTGVILVINSPNNFYLVTAKFITMNAQAISAISSVLMVVITTVAIIIAWWQIKMSRDASREATAMTNFKNYLQLAVDNPKLSSEKMIPPPESDQIELTRYKWFVDTMLFALEEIYLVNKKDRKNRVLWKQTITAHVERHSIYLNTKKKDLYSFHTEKFAELILQIIGNTKSNNN